jgi:hypothetical protein
MHRLTEHRCKHCGALLALIDERARLERFALACPECGAWLVLRPAKRSGVVDSAALIVATLDIQAR